MNINKIEVNGTEYNVEDTEARNSLQTLSQSVSESINGINAVIPIGASASNQLTTEARLTGLVSIVETEIIIPKDTVINNTLENQPNCAWSDDFSPVAPTNKAVLLAVNQDCNLWYPCITIAIKNQSCFNLVAPIEYTVPIAFILHCIWFIPRNSN